VGLGAVSALAENLSEVCLFFDDGAVEAGSLDFYYVAVATPRKNCDLAVKAFKRLILVEQRLVAFFNLEDLNRHLLLTVQIQGEFYPKNIRLKVTYFAYRPVPMVFTMR
jgi:hypothetical protein